MEKIVGPYQKPKAGFYPYDPRAPKVAALVKARIEERMPEITIEHIGSTAVPGCPGKGVVDLMALYPDNRLDDAVSLLAAMGYQRQGKEFRNRFPDSRPVYMGTYCFDHTPFLVYVHVIQQDAYEATRFRIFRDRLRNDPDLLTEYAAVKQDIISQGVVDTDDYAIIKKRIIEKVLGNDLVEKRLLS